MFGVGDGQDPHRHSPDLLAGKESDGQRITIQTICTRLVSVLGRDKHRVEVSRYFVTSTTSCHRSARGITTTTWVVFRTILITHWPLAGIGRLAAAGQLNWQVISGASGPRTLVGLPQRVGTVLGNDADVIKDAVKFVGANIRRVVDGENGLNHRQVLRLSVHAIIRSGC